MSEHNRIDQYLHDLGGVATLLRQAQDAAGDDRHHLLDLTAQAWREARRAAGLTTFLCDRNLIEIETPVLKAEGIRNRAYTELVAVYTQQHLSQVRRVLGRLARR